MTIALVFPGQGSQYVGMGDSAREHPFFKRADEVFDFSLSDLCFNGPLEKLKLTQYTQPAIVLHSLVLFDTLMSELPENIVIDYVLGHSVGEYSALAASGVFELEQVLKAVHRRGLAMQEAVPVGVGSMIAIMKLDASIIQSSCDKVSKKADSIVSIANHNSPSQVVISGDSKACHEVVSLLKEDGHRFRSVELPVSAPFHCQLMEPAKQSMSEHFEQVPLKANSIKYIANIDAQIHEVNSSTQKISNNLINQISGQVRWVESIEKLPANTKVIEVGPGKVLTGLCKKIREDISILTLDSPESFDKLSDFISES